MNQKQSIFVGICWGQKRAMLAQHVRTAGMLLVKISLYWLLPLNHAFERLNSLEGIKYQKKSHQRKTLKGKSQHLLREVVPNYTEHTCYVQEELTETCDKLGKGYWGGIPVW